MEEKIKEYKLCRNFDYPDTELYVTEVGYSMHNDALYVDSRLHDVFSIHFVCNGQGYFNGQKICAGEAFFTYPHEAYLYEKNDNSKWEHFYICFSGKRAYTVMDYFRKRYNKGIFDFDNSKILYEFLYPAIVKNTIRSGYEFMGILYSLIALEKKKRVRGREEYVKCAVEFIKINYKYHITVVDVARSIRVAPKYLSRVFKQCTGMTLQECIINRRIERASYMLKSGDTAVKRIANMVGYENEFAFSQAFKRVSGVSPSVYRMSHLYDKDI